MKNVLRELQVDWEDFLKVDFNPLPHAYALKIQSGRADALKNMYHALQATMDRVVEDNYEKLSQSVSLYEEIYDKYLQCSALLAENKDLSRKVGKRMAETVDSNLEMEIGEEKKKLDVLEKIQNINDKLKLIKMQRAVHLNDLPGNVDFFVTSVQFMDQMDGLYAITEMRQNLLAFGKFLFKNISERLEILVFTLDEIENHEIDVLLNLIKRLGAIEKFDNRLYKNFKKNLFGNFEALTTSKNLVPKIVKYAQNVFRRIARMKKKIIIPEMENFFEEEKENKIKIFRESDDVVIKLIIYEIKRLVTAYSDEEGFVSNIFHVEYIENTVNFADLFQTRFKISKIFQNVNLTPEYGEYTVTRPPECAFLIDFHKFVSKKIELSNVKLISERTIGMDINHQNTKMHAGDKILHEIMRMTNKMISDVYRHKDIHFKREVERILNKENAHNLNLTSGTVHYIQKITNLFKKYKTKFDFFPSFFDCTDLIFDKLEADLQIAFSSVIADTLDLDFQDFKKTIPKKRIEISEYPQNSFFFTKSALSFKKVFNEVASHLERIETSLKIEEMRERIHMICKRYKRGYKYENILNIFYYFDKLCREGNFSSPNQNELLIAQIRKTILSSQRGQIKTQKLHKNAKFPEIFDINNPIIDNPNIQNNEEDSSTEENLRAKLENLTFKSKSYFEGLFEFLNHYMETNLQNLNLKSKNELRVFIETLNSIEELFHTFEIEDDSFDPVIEKLENVLIGKVKEGPEAWLCNKIKE